MSQPTQPATVRNRPRWLEYLTFSTKTAAGWSRRITNPGDAVERLFAFLESFRQLPPKPAGREGAPDLRALHGYFFPAALVSKIEEHAGAAADPRVVYIVVHDQTETSPAAAAAAGAGALETDIVGVYSDRRAANARVLGFAEAKIRQEEACPGGAERLEDVAGSWWRVSGDGLVGVGFQSALDRDHEVYAYAMEVSTSGLAGGADVAFPARRWWSYV